MGATSSIVHEPIKNEPKIKLLEEIHVESQKVTISQTKASRPSSTSHNSTASSSSDKEDQLLSRFNKTAHTLMHRTPLGYYCDCLKNGTLVSLNNKDYCVTIEKYDQ